MTAAQSHDHDDFDCEFCNEQAHLLMIAIEDAEEAASRPPLAITVYGQPAPQGSKRHLGRGVMVEMSKKVKPWREAVKAAALAVLLPGHRAPLDGPLVADMVFTFARPKSHYRTGRNAHLLRDTAPAAPIGPPDLSKLARSTEDALTDAGAWIDDARVVAYRRLAKVYAATPGDPDALHIPGAVIRIRPLEVSR